MSEQTIHLPIPALDGPWRADAYGAKLVPARNGKGFEDLMLFDQKSMAFYGSFDDSRLKAALRHTLSWAFRQRESFDAIALDRFGLMDEARATAQHPPLHAADYGLTLDLIRSFIEHGESYSALLRSARLSWSPNGRYLVGLFPLASDELDREELRSKLSRLIELAELTPLRPIFVLENPRRMPAAIQQVLSWQAFIGQDQLRYGRDRYPMTPEAGMETRIPIGIALDRTTDSMRVLNGLSYEPTAEALERKTAVAEDASNYKRFLEGLTDGS